MTVLSSSSSSSSSSHTYWGHPSSSHSIKYPRRLLLRLPRVRGLLVAQHQPIEIRHHPSSLPRIRVVRIQPPTSTPANQYSGSASRPRRSARLNPGLDQACSIKGPPGARAPQSQQSDTMARTYPLSLGFNQCLGAKEEPFAFSSVCVEDLRNGDLEYLSTIEQLVGALPKTEHPASRFALRGHVTLPGHQRLRHSMRAALWWLLPLDGEFHRASHSLHYYLARQGRGVVLRWGDVTRPFYESRVNWVTQPPKFLLPF